MAYLNANIYWPTIKTREEVLEERRDIIVNSPRVINHEQALKQFEENPDIEFEFISVGDVLNELGIRNGYYNDYEYQGWLVEKGYDWKKQIIFNGVNKGSE